MSSRYRIEEFAAAIRRLVAVSPLCAAAAGPTHLVVNPAAGRISSRRAFARSIAQVHAVATELEAERTPLVKGRSELDFRLHLTDDVGHGHEIAEGIAGGKGVVITAGGDGTHEEVMEGFAAAGPQACEGLLFHRLPMGTGNDAPFDADLDGALGTLALADSTRPTGAVRVTTAEGRIRYSFNIASLGVDAYITDVSNRVKRLLPGDIYRSVADISVIFYEPVYKLKEMRILLTPFGNVNSAKQNLAEDASSEHVVGTFLLVAMGISGRRTYGDGKLVLPGDENFCAMHNTTLRRRLALRKTFYAGNHVNEPEALVRSARRCEIHYDGKIPVQFDGEALWLDHGSFPVTMEVLDGVLKCFAPPGTESD